MFSVLESNKLALLPRWLGLGWLGLDDETLAAQRGLGPQAGPTWVNVQHLAYAPPLQTGCMHWGPFSHEAGTILDRALHHRRTDHGADQRVRAICAERGVGDRLRLALAGRWPAGRGSDVDFHVWHVYVHSSLAHCRSAIVGDPRPRTRGVNVGIDTLHDCWYHLSAAAAAHFPLPWRRRGQNYRTRYGAPYGTGSP